MLGSIKNNLQKLCRNILNDEQYKAVRAGYRIFFSLIYKKDLNKLAVINGSDKWGHHFYTKHYQKHFQCLRNKKINILEIGIGGDNVPGEGGASLKMWHSYFSKANIFGIDIFEKSFLDSSRIKTFRGDQVDECFLAKVVKEAGGFDIIIDDGSHVSEHMIKTFQILFPSLRDGGFYAIEDLLSSYDPRYGGDNQNLNNPVTVMNFLKSLADNVNEKNIDCSEKKLRFNRIDIVSVHFYHNLTIVQKGKNIGLDFSAQVKESLDKGTTPWVWVKQGEDYRRSKKS